MHMHECLTGLGVSPPDPRWPPGGEASRERRGREYCYKEAACFLLLLTTVIVNQFNCVSEL